MTVVLDGASLTLEDVVSVAFEGEQVTLLPEARERMQAHRDVVEAALAGGERVYGLTTGVAERKRVALGRGPAEQSGFNRALVRNHRIAQGPLASPALVRATMLILANVFSLGVSGVRPALVDLLLQALSAGTEPPVRTLGSVGAADLGPLADLADYLVTWAGYELAENEGLALLDNNAFGTASAALALRRAERLLDDLDLAAALDLEAYAGNVSALHPIVSATRPSSGLAISLANLRRALHNSALFDEGVARNLQDPLTFRCIPQVHGAARDAVAYARGAVEDEMNSSQGNPIVVLAERRLVSVGNFEAVGLSAAVDFARIGLLPALTSAAERTVKLLQSPSSGLAPGLSANPDSGDDGLAELAVTSQSLAVEAKLLAQPVSFELVSTSKAEGIEDRTSMAPLSARRLDELVALAGRLLAIELVVAAQAVELRRLPSSGTGTARAVEAIRRRIPFAEGDAPFGDLEPMVNAVRAGEFSAILDGVPEP